MEPSLEATLYAAGTLPIPTAVPYRKAIAGMVQRGILSTPLPSPTMTPFLTVKEASALTGKSPSSIRRIIYPIIHDDTHLDRIHIQPAVDEAMQLRVRGENFAWRVSEEFLRREIPVEAPTDRQSGGAAPRPLGHPDAELIAMLRAEVEIKNRQISQQSELIGKQMELISGLSERMREGNVLLGSLQQRLALPPEKRTPSTPQSVSMKRPGSTPKEKGSTITPKTVKPKTSFLSRIFG